MLFPIMTFKGKFDHKGFWPTCLLSSHIWEENMFIASGKLIATNMGKEMEKPSSHFTYCPVSPLEISILVLFGRDISNFRLEGIVCSMLDKVIYPPGSRTQRKSSSGLVYV